MDDCWHVKLEKPSSFTPVALAAADDSDLKAAQWASLLGWAYVPEDRIVRAHELQNAEVRVLKNGECSKFMTIDDTMACDSGLENEDSCQGDVGAPLVIEDKSGDVFFFVVQFSTLFLFFSFENSPALGRTKASFVRPSSMGNVTGCYSTRALDTRKSPLNGQESQSATPNASYKADEENVGQPLGNDKTPKEKDCARESQASGSSAKPFLTVCTPLLSSEGVSHGGGGNYGNRH
ncbi:hypothetical protein ON010_g14069 [Phytophthora cinnamomi]|nr:hypothetical protein ON010_g14069 [Phytophthora cinnamomi]